MARQLQKIENVSWKVGDTAILKDYVNERYIYYLASVLEMDFMDGGKRALLIQYGPKNTIGWIYVKGPNLIGKSTKSFDYRKALTYRQARMVLAPQDATPSASKRSKVTFKRNDESRDVKIVGVYIDGQHIGDLNSRPYDYPGWLVDSSIEERYGVAIEGVTLREAKRIIQMEEKTIHKRPAPPKRPLDQWLIVDNYTTIFETDDKDLMLRTAYEMSRRKEIMVAHESHGNGLFFGPKHTIQDIEKSMARLQRNTIQRRSDQTWVTKPLEV